MFESAFMRVALVASIATSVPLSVVGVYLVVRRVVFLGLVLANAATVGAAVASVVGWPPEVASMVAAVVAALGLGLMSTPRRISSEAIIGCGSRSGARGPVARLTTSRVIGVAGAEQYEVPRFPANAQSADLADRNGDGRGRLARTGDFRSRTGCSGLNVAV
ncbi:MAG TPA: metal ABC transporter permease, partial [Vicinamibacterales bacterium]|nr:metal ABC transporter permease [Vicinamibacterales bacterium]